MFRKILFFIFSVFMFGSCDTNPSLKQWVEVDPEIVEKPFQLNVNPQVDILFVVDDSGSMDVFQQTLAENIDAFIDTIFDSRFIDYHIAVTTSSPEHEPYNSVAHGGRFNDSAGHSVVSRKLKFGKKVLRKNLLVGDDGSGEETFFENVRRALSKPLLTTTNANFLRKRAHLFLFFLSDSDDHSREPTNAFKKFIFELKGGRENLIHFGGALRPLDGSCTTIHREPLPEKINTFSSEVDGEIFNICKDFYGENLAKIAKGIVREVSVVRLDEVPVVSTIEVSFGYQRIPQSLNKGWTYNATENLIFFGDQLELKPGSSGDRLSISFEAVYKK